MEHAEDIATVLDYITYEIFSVNVHQTKESWELPFADDQTALGPNEEIHFAAHFQPHVVLLHLSSVLHFHFLLESAVFDVCEDPSRAAIRDPSRRSATLASWRLRVHQWHSQEIGHPQRCS